MANNRLYIEDTETGERFMLAKSMGEGWYTRNENEGEATFQERFDAWLEGGARDSGASYRNREEPTRFRIVTENEMETTL